MSQVRSVRKTGLSGMPPGLVNGLSEEEVADLVAYVQAGGSLQSNVYARPVR